MDINTAKLIYNSKLQRIMSLVQFTAEESALQGLISGRDLTGVAHLNRLIRSEPGTAAGNDHALLDMLAILDHRGKVLYRVGNPASKGDNLLTNVLVRTCIEKKMPVSSTELMSLQDILRENPALLNGRSLVL